MVSSPTWKIVGKKMGRKYYSSLESLRGIAALMVAISHSFIAVTFGGQDLIWVKTLAEIHGLEASLAKLILFFGNGDAGVCIFFVLSGVVLGLSLDGAKDGLLRTYVSFLIKRIFRIYPAHLLVLSIICLTLATGLQNPGSFEGATTWFNWFYRSSSSLTEVASNALLLKSSLNPVTWSLIVEIAISLAFPVLHALLRLKAKPLFVQSLILLVLIALPHFHPGSLVLPHAYKFYAGLLLPVYGIRYIRFLTDVIKLPVAALFSMAVFLLVVERQITDERYMGYGLIQVLGASAIVLLLMSSKEDMALFKNRFIQNLGRYSFSFYLWHFPILWFMYLGIYSAPPLHQALLTHTLPIAIVVCVASVLTAYILGAINYHFVEVRFIEIGRKIATMPSWEKVIEVSVK